MNKELELFPENPTCSTSEEELVRTLKSAEEAYYNRSSGTMEDAEYDRLRDELAEIAPNHPHLSKVGAPLEATGMLSKKPHSMPMGSQRKAMNKDEFYKWAHSAAKALGKDVGSFDFSFSYKVDGGSFSFDFVDGVLVECLSRGDGFVGLEVTDNARKFQGIPDVVYDPRSGRKFTGLIRGEVVLFVEDWKFIDPEMTTNPRNVGNGIAGRESGVDSDKLHVIAFRAYEKGREIADTESEMARIIDGMGFDVAPSASGRIDSIWNSFEKLDTHRRDGSLSIPYWIDGAVVKLDSIADQTKLGSSGNRPKGQIAVKFAAVGTPSALEDVVLSVGHTGLISPTGAFTPVQISGTTVSSALLVNWDNIEELDIAVGDKVELYKAGEIIPRVLRVVERPSSRKPIPRPTCCPVCSGEVGKKKNVGGHESSHLFCLNPDCRAKASGKIGRYIKSLNILGIGDEVLLSMTNAGIVGSAADLYSLKSRKSQLANLTMVQSGVRIGENRAESIISEIEKKRSLTIPELLGSLGIDHLGKRRVEIIMKAVPGKLDKLDSWFDGTLLTCAEEARIPNMAQPIHENLQRLQPTIQAILNNGVNVTAVEFKEAKEGAISFCITGKLSQPKKAYQTMIQDAGHIWKTSVTSDLDYLVIADPDSPSSKAKKARSLGVKCVSEVELAELCQSQ
jgi:DNA ligase (NAD+)